VPVEEGSVVEISGWLRVDQAIAGGLDGLAIVDSLGGAELSLTVRETDDWQPFRMFRGVPTSTELRLTFALSGIGSVAIDGVTVRAFESAAVRRLPAVSPMDRSAINATDAGPVFVAPATR
jgi:hypothetical protein